MYDGFLPTESRTKLTWGLHLGGLYLGSVLLEVCPILDHGICPNKNFGPKGSWLPPDCGDLEVSEGPPGSTTGKLGHDTLDRTERRVRWFGLANLLPQLSACVSHLEKAGPVGSAG